MFFFDIKGIFINNLMEALMGISYQILFIRANFIGVGRNPLHGKFYITDKTS